MEDNEDVKRSSYSDAFKLFVFEFEVTFESDSLAKLTSLQVVVDQRVECLPLLFSGTRGAAVASRCSWQLFIGQLQQLRLVERSHLVGV